MNKSTKMPSSSRKKISKTGTLVVVILMFISVYNTLSLNRYSKQWLGSIDNTIITNPMHVLTVDDTEKEVADIKREALKQVIDVDMEDPTMLAKNVAIIGGAGYVGSYLAEHLNQNDFRVTVFDTNPTIIQNINAYKIHSSLLSADDLNRYGTVIFLGGCTSTKACATLSKEDATVENVDNVLKLVKHLRPDQHFITASTSAVSIGREDATEHDPVHEAELDEYSSTMYQSENSLRDLVVNSESTCRITMLRFGTVVGNSPSQRTDSIVPTFFNDAYSKGVLHIESPESFSSFLSLDDLSRAVNTVMTSKAMESLEMFNIWNLKSFDATVMKVATTISVITGATIDMSKEEMKKYLEPFSIKNFKGFTVNTDSFSSVFNFTFNTDMLSVLTDIDAKVPHSIIPKGPHKVIESHDDGTIPCPVCGSTDSKTVLDLTDQPSPFDFKKDTEAAMKSPRSPLRLVRCRVCNHYHLSNVVDRDLFDHSFYDSDATYSEWLADKVMEESELAEGAKGNILEIASHDGTHLDHYKQQDWGTFGVEHEIDFVDMSSELGHIIRRGLWPIDFRKLPKGNKLTAIVAQNVLAHVPDAVAFLKACAKVMGVSTKLYIQTSYCNMLQVGQFDTIHHEHLSYFTGHSFLKASELSGLVITSFETTPIHRESCLVTMQLKEAFDGNDGKDEADASSTGIIPRLQERLDDEVKESITNDFFAEKFSAKADESRNWIKGHLLRLQSNGYLVGGYSAAPNGMALLNFLLDNDEVSTSLLSFVLDNSKSGTHCPGTAIPVIRTDDIKDMDKKKPLALIVFAWEQFDYVVERLRIKLKGIRREVTLIVPFPTPRIYKVMIDKEEAKRLEDSREPSSLDWVLKAQAAVEEQLNKELTEERKKKKEESNTDESVKVEPEEQVSKEESRHQRRLQQIKSTEDISIRLLESMSYNPTLIPNQLNPIIGDTSRPKTLMATTYRNEELLLPQWIIHHAPMFDKVILIDYDSDDTSNEVIEKFAPSTWEITRSTTGSSFGAAEADAQTTVFENQYENDGYWTMVLTTGTEFLVKSDFRLVLSQTTKDHPDMPIKTQLPAFYMFGNDTEPYSYLAPLPKQRALAKAAIEPHYSRWLHYKTSDICEYVPGRHFYPCGEFVDDVVNLCMDEGIGSGDGFILKYKNTPWPQVIERKISVGKTIPQSDIDKKFGFQHTAMNSVEAAQKEQDKLLAEFGNKEKSVDFCTYDSDEFYKYHRELHDFLGECY